MSRLGSVAFTVAVVMPYSLLVMILSGRILLLVPSAEVVFCTAWWSEGVKNYFCYCICYYCYYYFYLFLMRAYS